MFQSLASKICVLIFAAVVGVAGWFHGTERAVAPQPPVQQVQIAEQQPEDKPLGATIPVVVSLFETSLQAKITSSDTSMTLVSGTDRNSASLSGYTCFTIDEGTPNVEFVCGTASSTAVSSLIRGIDPTTGTTSVTALKKSHNRGATVKITNYPQLAIVSRILNGDETLPNRLSYVSTIATSTFSTYNLVSKQYVDGVVLQGAPTATSTTPGVVQLASGSQLSSGTAMSGAYTLVPANSFFNSTPQSATTVPVTLASGKLAQGFLDLTAGWTFSGTVTNSATTTLTGPVIFNSSTSTLFSSALIANATSTFNAPFTSNSTTTLSGGLSGFNTFKVGAFNKNSADGTSTTTIAHALGTVPRFAQIECTISATNGFERANTFYNGTTQSSNSVYSVSGGNTNSNAFVINGANAAATLTGTVTWDSTNVYIGWVGSGSPTGTYNCVWSIQN